MKFYLFTFLTLCVFVNINAQPGCTDPQAENYNPFANQNDGSCMYPETTYSLDQIVELPDALIENSGLVHLPEGLYTHNDAGNPNEIYRIDSLTGEVLQTLLVVGDNEDWEDMAESETHIFLGDFGNNKGDRTDLRIYKIAKAELANNIINAQPINFFYTDQTDFSENQNNHDFDCEAFFYHNDSLHLFTKNWVDNQTRYYAIPAGPGFHSAIPKATFNVNGLITSADINEDGTVVLIGYTEVGQNFMWLLFDYPNQHFFNGHKRRIELGTALVNSQTEAVTFKNNEGGYISSEQFDLGQVELPPKLLSFTIDQWIPGMISTSNDINLESEIRVFPNPFENNLTLSLPENWLEGPTTIEVYDTDGKPMLTQAITPTSRKIILQDLEELPTGVYVLRVRNKEFFWEEKVVKH